MKNKSYIGISFIVLIFGIIFIPKIVDRIKNGTVTQNDRMSLSKEITETTQLQKIGPAPEFELTDQNGNKISNKSYLGKVYVLEFFFSTCPSICPIMNKNMVTIQDEFRNEKNFGIASISINPENDTPAVLKDHAKKIGATAPNWHFLTGDKEYIFNLANKGFNLYVGENSKAIGNFEHSGLFALIDKNGTIRCRKDAQGNPILYYDGLEQKGVTAIKEDIKLLLKE
ncbi:SCO family protein [Flavobacterium aciduliphilum]|uniref:Protein SCO1/2 n=1 Tax=Flavobacterium aciduliphilum TaxID=1101402 RepID=A0A328YCW1_9FLAO|nr:SCO family protein [Flavobacterium aciduliphilum]RAR71779.1 protein SCO1/2 [Flavobacterium aciduliphilum]